MGKKKQTRRSVSVTGLAYQRAKNYCDRVDRSVSSFVEEVLAQRLDAEGEPLPERVDPRLERPAREDFASGIFTF